MWRKINLIILLIITQTLPAQFSYSGYLYNANASGARNVPVRLYRRTSTTTTNLTVKVFRTHYGTGSTSQYGQFANNATDMGKMVNSAYAATTLLGTHSISATTALNWSNAGTIRNAGVNAPSNGDYFSVEVTGTFIPTQTGTYSFGINSDDGSDLLIGGTLVTSYYGGHGMSGYRYGTIYLVAGTSYSFKARMQEYGGGEGLAVVWRRPSGGSYTIWTSELAGAVTWSSWSLYKTLYTNTSGYFSVSESATNAEYYLQINAPTRIQAYTISDLNAVSDIILGLSTRTGLSYHMFDVNDDGQINVADEYYIYARQRGFFSRWRTAGDVRIFTTSEYNTIRASTTNVRTTYPGTTTITTSTLSSGGSLIYYLIAPGYAGSVTY